MVQNLAKSPLALSIGGVGAIAIALIGVSYLGQTSPSDSATSEPEKTLNTLEASPWQQGTDLGWQAAVAAQGAQTQADWQQVSDLWGQAIAALEKVPADDPNYAQAQAKAKDYRANQSVAATEQASAPPGLPPAMASLQQALAATEPAFTFAPGPAANTFVGQSADGLATIELAGDRASLVLPRSDQGGAITMAQVVYANQFLSIAAPETKAQPWVIEALSNVQSDRSPAIPANIPVTLSAKTGALTITVVAEP